MPNQPKTPTRPIRIDLALWDRFGELADPDRSAVLRDFVRWYVGQPGAKMPRRPNLANRSDESDQGAGSSR